MPPAHRDRLKIMNLTKVIMIIVMGLYEVLPICGQNKVSLTFVIDNTMSMDTEINQVISSTNDIFKTVTNSKSSIIENFIIVTFNDPITADLTSEVRVNTKNENVFRDALTSIDVHGGADCPEYPITGIEHALNESLPGSMLYVFTDASAKDYMEAPRVIALAQEKESQVTFVLTGNCTDEKTEKDLVYNNVAHETSGEVFNILKDEVKEVLKYVTNQLIQKNDDLIDKIKPKVKVIPIDIESTITDITISVTGDAPQFEVKGPDGNTVATEDIVTTQHLKIVKVAHITPGKYTIHLHSDNIISVKVRGSTAISFNYGFTKNKSESFEKTSRRPISGEEYSLSIKLNNTRQDIILDSIELIDLEENTLLTKPLQVIDKNEKIYATDSFISPEKTFKIVIMGENSINHERVKRMSPTPIQPQIIEKKAPVVHIQGDSQRYVNINERLSLICDVTGYPKPAITFEDGSGTLLESQASVVRLPYDYISRLDVDKLNRNNTYKCKAKNEVGEHDNSVEIYIKSEIPTTTEATVMNKIPTVTIEGDLNRIVKYGESLQLVCSISGYPKPIITWQDGFGSILPTATETPVSGSIYNHKSILKVDKVDKTNAYICIARNELGAHNVTVEVQLEKKAPVVTIVGDLKRIVKYGEALELVCSVNGYPKPTIVWQDITGRTLSTVTQTPVSGNIYNHKSILKVDKVDKTNAYICIARNEVGAHNVTVEVQLEKKVPVVTIVGDLKRIVKYGEALELVCSVNAYPEPTIVWQDITGRTLSTVTQISDSEHPYNYNSTLRIDAVDKDDSYKCTAQNEVDTDSSTIEVQLEGISPIVTIEGGLKRFIDLNESLTLECKVNGYPQPSITWKNTDGEILPSEVSTLDIPYNYASKLFIEIIDKSEAYTCEATNEIGQNNKTVEVSRKEYFNIINKPQDTIIEYNKEGYLTCKVDAYPPAKISWYINEKEVLETEYVEISKDGYTLHIKEMTPQTAGNYICEARSDKDRKVFPFNVKISGVEPSKIDKSITEMSTSLGSSVDILCRANGKPKPKITWYVTYLNGDDTSYIIDQFGEICHLNNVSHLDAGTYKCIAENVWNTDTHEIELKINYAPVIDGKSNDKIFAKSGEYVKLHCNSRGSPLPKIVWYVNGAAIKETKKWRIFRNRNYMLKFKATIDDIGSYTCVAMNEFGNATKTTTVEISSIPRIKTPIKFKIEAEVNTMVTLECKADGFPKPEIEWIFHSFDQSKPEKPHKPSNERGERHFDKIQGSQQGYYTCVATNTGGSTNITYAVHVYLAPIIRPSPENTLTAVKEDSVLVVPCQTVGIPPPKVTWKYAIEQSNEQTNVPLGHGFFDMTSDNSLIIRHLTAEVAGLYICRAENGVRNSYAEQKYSVTVIPYPRKGEPSSTVLLADGDSKSIPCEENNNKLSTNIRWYKVDPETKLLTDRELHLRNVRPSDAGIYTCRINYEWSNSKSVHTRVLVGFKPQFNTNEPKIIDHVVGKEAVLRCAATARPEAKITWWHDGKQLESTNTIYNFYMTVPDVGQYFCSVSNEFGVITRKFDIISQDCILNMKTDFPPNHQPLILKKTFRWPQYKSNSGFITVPRNEQIVLTCSSEFANFPTTEIRPICIGDKKFEYDSKTHSFANFNCKQEVQPVVRNTRQSCSSNPNENEEIRIGFETKGEFIEVYTVCLDVVKRVPIYAKHTMNKNIADIDVSESKMYHKDMVSVNMDVFNKCEVNDDDDDEDDEDDDENCCYMKRKLVNPRDVLPSAQRATFSYLNVVPQWSNCNSQNWRNLERLVRNMAKASDNFLIIRTGVSFLDQNNIPKYIWKVIQDPSQGASLAVIQINIPNFDKSEAKVHIPCTDICPFVDWMKNPSWREPKRGYIFCCTLEDFQEAFEYDGNFDSNRLGNILHNVP